MKQVIKPFFQILRGEFPELDDSTLETIIYLSLFNEDRSMVSFEETCNEITTIDPTADKETVRMNLRLEACRGSCQDKATLEYAKQIAASEAAATPKPAPRPRPSFFRLPSSLSSRIRSKHHSNNPK